MKYIHKKSKKNIDSFLINRPNLTKRSCFKLNYKN